MSSISIHSISPSAEEITVPLNSVALNSNTMYRPFVIGNCLIPTSLGLVIFNPVSSLKAVTYVITFSKISIYFFFYSADPCICQHIRSSSVIARITRHGLPAARLFAEISLVTTLPAPITQPSPIVTPPQIVTFPAIQQLLPSILNGR